MYNYYLDQKKRDENELNKKKQIIEQKIKDHRRSMTDYHYRQTRGLC